jgi:tetratricopeptide (TPR) repeat protein
MMRRLLRNRIVLALAFLVAVVAVRYGSSALLVGKVAPAPEASTTVREAASGPGAPSSDNVSHEFRRRVAELSDRITAAPADTAALHELARMLFDAHAMEEAADLYARYLALEPAARQTWLDLANAQAALRRWEDAERTMLGMLDAFPDDPAATWNLGAILANQGRTEEAATWWHRTVESADTALAGQARRALSMLYGP